MMMFGMGRRRAVERRAKALGDLLHRLVGMVESMSFEEFIEYAERQSFDESYCDLKAKKFGFFEVAIEKADFSFHADYGDTFGQPTIVVENHRNYCGLHLSGSSLRLGIHVDLSEVLPSHELGRDARALQTALLKFPGFTSTAQIMERLRSP